MGTRGWDSFIIIKPWFDRKVEKLLEPEGGPSQGCWFYHTCHEFSFPVTFGGRRS